MNSEISEKIRRALEKFHGNTAERLSSLLTEAFQKVDREQAREIILKAMNVMAFFPAIVLLIANLVIDARVPLLQKLNIALLIAWIIVPDDPALLALIGPAAYLDDTVILLYAIFLVAQLIGTLSEEVIRDNWVGDLAQADELVKAAAALGNFLGSRITLDQTQAIIQSA